MPKGQSCKYQDIRTHTQFKRLYNAYRAFYDKCYNEYSSGYKLYGERNIRLCDEWKLNFRQFFDWAIENGYNSETTIILIPGCRVINPDNCYVVLKKDSRKIIAELSKL